MLSTTTRTGMAFALAVLILLFVGWTAIKNTQELIGSSRLVAHTQQVLQTLEVVISSLADVETSQRGFQLSGNEAYLAPFKKAEAAIPTTLSQLRRLTNDNAVQQEQLGRLEPVLQQKLAFSSNVVRLRRTQGAEAALKLFATGQGLRLTEQIRQSIIQMKQEEERLLKLRTAESESNSSRATTIVSLGLLAAALLVGISGFLVTRALLLKERAESSLKKVFNSRDAAESLARDSSQMSSVSTQLANSATETSRQMQSATGTAAEVNASVQQVATAIEEMGASIREIARNASEAARIARNGVKVAGETNHTIQDLQASSVEMGKVIKLITTVAQQTKLLALNATIEAARAGSAGKGFAVVANEVKELAKETAQASEEIADRILTIQEVSQSTIQALADISLIIEQIADLQGMIASAVEEQSVVTHEINHNVTAVARSSESINRSISSVASAAGDTADGAKLVQQTSSNLAQLASQLRSLMDVIGT